MGHDWMAWWTGSIKLQNPEPNNPRDRTLAMALWLVYLLPPNLQYIQRIPIHQMHPIHSIHAIHPHDIQYISAVSYASIGRIASYYSRLRLLYWINWNRICPSIGVEIAGKWVVGLLWESDSCWDFRYCVQLVICSI